MNLPDVDWSKFDTIAGPVAGATIALVGVLVGLLVTGAMILTRAELDALRAAERQARIREYQERLARGEVTGP